MFDVYSLCRFHHARGLRQQCHAPSARKTSVKFWPFGHKGFRNLQSLTRSNPLEVRGSTDVYWDRIPLKLAKSIPHLRSVLFQDHRSEATMSLREGTERERFAHVKTLQDLDLVLKGLVIRLPNSKTRKELALLLITLGDLIAETKPLRTKTFETLDYANELPDYTRIFSRFVHAGLPIPQILMFHGLKAAACGNSPMAMRHYLSLFCPQFKIDPAYRIQSKQWDMIVNCILVTNRSPPGQSEMTLRQEKAWSEVVAYRKVRALIDMNSRREGIVASFSIYDIFIEFGIDGMSNYFRLVSRFCESQAIFEWGMNCLVLGLYDRKLPPATLNFIFNSYIQTLLAKKSPEQAWKLAQKALPNFGTIHDKTWKLLLWHPEHLAEWKPGMKNHVIRALERYMLIAEYQLGVKWTGGEDGFHMPRGEDPVCGRDPGYRGRHRRS